MNQRPAHIAAILKTLDAKIGASLEAYIADLESRQPDITPIEDASPTDPVWSTERIIKRDQRRRERASRERNNYQSVTEPYLTIVEKK